MKQNSLTGFMNEVIVELQQEGVSPLLISTSMPCGHLPNLWEVVKSSGEV